MANGFSDGVGDITFHSTALDGIALLLPFFYSGSR